MKRISIRKMIVLVIAISVWAAACNSTKTIEKAERLAIELRLYNRNIARTTNEAFRDQKISADLHLAVIKSCDQFSKSLDAADMAIKAVRVVTSKTDQKSGLDFVERLFDTEVFTAFIGIVEAVTDVPAAVKARIETILTTIKLAFATIRALFADAHVALREETYA